MDTCRTQRWSVRWLAGLGVGGLLALSGCGDGGPPAEAGPPAAVDGGVVFDEVAAAVPKARIAMCDPAEGGAFIPLPAPSPAAASTASYFRYVQGRIYEFGPCEAPPNKRNELRLFRYTDTETRDAAIRDMAARHTRPTSAFAVADVYEAQIWSPDPSLEGPVGQAAAAVHVAISRVERARHLDVGP